MTARILIVDDEPNIRTTLARSLQLEGYQCVTAGSVEEGRQVLSAGSVDLVMLDVKLPDGNGLDLLEAIKRERADAAVIMMSGHGTVDMALEAIRKGAHDFLEKPLSTERILITVANALRFADQGQELRELQVQVRARTELLGSSAVMDRLRETIALAAPTKGRVLIMGESGTGKELIARALHEGSKRRSRAFVKVNCAAIPAELIESELFGHERGAFTGAHQARKGKFELAHQGTLFLDEVGDMRLDVQAKLLRALQEGEIERVGGSRTIGVDVRVVAATNKDLEAAIEAKEFREDLYYRLNVVRVEAPPLRVRKEDLRELVDAFMHQVCEDNGIRLKEVTSDSIAVLAEHDWPGNVRELRNACERLVILNPGPVVEARAVRALLGEGRQLSVGLYRSGASMKELVAEAERAIILGALDAHGGHVTQTAAALGLERSHLYKKMRGLHIERG